MERGEQSEKNKRKIKWKHGLPNSELATLVHGKV